jgi:hypothetical protein
LSELFNSVSATAQEGWTPVSSNEGCAAVHHYNCAICQDTSRAMPAPPYRSRLPIHSRNPAGGPSKAPPPAQPTTIEIPRIRQEITTHPRQIEHGYPYAPVPRTDKLPVRGLQPHPGTGRGGMAAQDKLKEIGQETTFKAAETRAIELFNSETDFEYEKQLKRSFWKAGLSRELCNKVIEAHRDKEQKKRELRKSGNARPPILREEGQRAALQPQQTEATPVEALSIQPKDVAIERWDDNGREILEEAEYYNKRALERARPGEASLGVLKDWSLVDLPPGTRLVTMQGAGGAVQKISWQKYNGCRRMEFILPRTNSARKVETGRPDRMAGQDESDCGDDDNPATAQTHSGSGSRAQARPRRSSASLELSSSKGQKPNNSPIHNRQN